MDAEAMLHIILTLTNLGLDELVIIGGEAEDIRMLQVAIMVIGMESHLLAAADATLLVAIVVEETE